MNSVSIYSDQPTDSWEHMQWLYTNPDGTVDVSFLDLLCVIRGWYDSTRDIQPYVMYGEGPDPVGWFRNRADAERAQKESNVPVRIAPVPPVDYNKLPVERQNEIHALQQHLETLMDSQKETQQ